MGMLHGWPLLRRWRIAGAGAVACVTAGMLVTITTSPLLAQAPVSAIASSAPVRPEVADALNALQALLPRINQTTGGVELRHWKVPSEVKDQTSADIQSIQHDLSGTLPGLITTALQSPGAVAPAFAVFRNVDALYDVLLRVTETATLAGSQSEAGQLEAVRAEVQSRRSQLGGALQGAATEQDASVVRLQSSLQTLQRQANAAPAAPKKIVVNDGPETTTHKRKPSSIKKAPPAASDTGATPQ